MLHFQPFDLRKISCALLQGYGPLAQLAEHLTFNQGVGSSSLPRPISKLDTAPDFQNERNVTLNRRLSANCDLSCKSKEFALTTLSDASAAYRICAKAEGKSPRTIGWISDAVRYFSEYLGGDVDLEKITSNELRGFISACQQKKTFSNHRFTRPQTKMLSPASVASYTRAIKTFFSFLEREELLHTNPVRKVRIPKIPKKIMPCFSESDLERLLAAPDKKTTQGYRDYVFMLTLLDTGVRVSELCGLKLEDVDLSNGYLRVMGKGAKERYVPVGMKLSKALLKYRMTCRPNDSGYDNFFLTKDGRPLVKRRVQSLIREYGSKMNITTRCSPHTFRSSSAVLYIRNQGDPFSLQKRLGHSSLTMTRHYCELADNDVRAAHLKHGVADRLKV